MLHSLLLVQCQDLYLYIPAANFIHSRPYVPFTFSGDEFAYTRAHSRRACDAMSQ